MFLGIDLGTSAVKVVLVEVARDGERVTAEASAPLDVSRPRPLWSEQDPEDWWRATDHAVRDLAARAPAEMAAVEAIGLSGQMHGATLLDAGDRVLRPAILWNDGRSLEQCRALEADAPVRTVGGNAAMPGFTAPKLRWVYENEPEVFGKVARVLLPKDWLRLRMTGETATDCSDASGTLWLDVAARAWSPALLAATHLGPDAMPAVFEGSQETGRLRAEVAEGWGLGRVPVAAGGGDQAAGAVGAGVVRPGSASLALGTSGVFFVADDRFRPHPDGGVHAFCHALPDRWHRMAVILSAASCLSWLARVTGAPDEGALLAEVEAAPDGAASTIFLPYLSGERTPHNDPNAQGVFFGLTHDTDRAALARAVLEGVAFAFVDGQRALDGAGATIDEVSVIGGGARSRFWGGILASALDRPLVYRAGGAVGPATGAARLARLCARGESPEEVCRPPAVEKVIEPDPHEVERYRERTERFRRLYRALADEFRAPGGA